MATAAAARMREFSSVNDLNELRQDGNIGSATLLVQHDEVEGSHRQVAQVIPGLQTVNLVRLKNSEKEL